MKSDSFWGLIPKGVKAAAAVVFVCAVIAGPLIGAWQGHVAGLNSMNGISPAVLASAIGLGMGLVVGACVAFWLLCLDMSLPMLVAAPCRPFCGSWSVSSFPTCLDFCSTLRYAAHWDRHAQIAASWLPLNNDSVPGAAARILRPHPLHERFSVACFRSRSGHRCLSRRGMIGAS